jgi:DNA primase
VSGRIPQDFIDDLVQRADIVEVVGGRVPLTRAGREYKARCPFHNEKTPSFWVSPAKGFYHCFGCGAHGTALGFLMEYERLDFPAAVEELARVVGVEVPREDGAPRQNLEPLYAVLEQAARSFRQQLKAHAAAVDYLRGRGLDGDTARDFGIGYAADAWDTLVTELGGSEADRAALKAAGLVVPRDSGGFYDRFRDRIMFPIRDTRGRVIAFGGRIVGAGEPKYLNSPETPLFHKGSELYGLYEARRAVRQPVRFLVVEGYMDVVMLAAHGIHNVVGTLGTATTAEHLRRLFGLVPEVVFCFDGDRAGREAAWRALQVSLPAMRDGRQVRFLLLPEGEDPDSLVRREGAEAFTARVAGAAGLSAFLLDRLAADVDLGSADGRARLAALARPLIAQVPDEVYRELLTAELAGRIGLEPQRVGALQGATAGPRPATDPARPRPRPPRAGGRGSLARQAIAILLHYPHLAVEVQLPEGLAGSGQKGAALLLELHALLAERPELRSAAIIERYRERPEGPHLEALLAADPLVPEDGARQELAGCLRRFASAAQQQRLNELLGRAAGLTPGEQAELEQLRRAVARGPGPRQDDAGPADRT